MKHKDDLILELSEIMYYHQCTAITLSALRSAMLSGDEVVVESFGRWFKTKRDICRKRGETDAETETLESVCDIIEAWDSERHQERG